MILYKMGPFYSREGSWKGKWTGDEGAKRKEREGLIVMHPQGGSVSEWLACWTQAQKGMGSNRSRDAVG